MSLGFFRIENDPALYWRPQDKGKKDFVLVYVDDIVIMVPKGSDSLHEIKEALVKEFKMKDIRELKSFLGIKVT